jgi:UDP-glucuronate 4-epimerase
MIMGTATPAFKRVLVTGAAGFIGAALSQRLLDDSVMVHGVDNLNPYYDVSLKEARLVRLTPRDGFTFTRADLSDRAAMEQVFAAFKPDAVVNLAAQAGVRHSIDHPHDYIDSNVMGFLNILEGCRHHAVKHLVFASSSSVYGGNEKTPFGEDDPVDHPVSLYAATKKANELMAHSYAHLYGIPCTGLRFFTVYGPWGRPDMAVFKFVKAVFDGAPIDVYNHGDMRRDFTFIDDIVEGAARLINVPATPDSSPAPYRLYNIGHNHPEKLLDMIKAIEEETGLTAQKNMCAMQPGDVRETYADITRLNVATGFAPKTELRTGIREFVRWYRDYYKIGNGPTGERA